MPRRRKPALAWSAPIQLPLFAEAATLVRTLPERDKHCYYRLEVWPDLLAAPYSCVVEAASAPRAGTASIPTPTRAPLSMPLLRAFEPNAGAAIAIARYE